MAPTPKTKKPTSTPAEHPEVLTSRIRPAQPSLIEALEPRVVFSVNIGAGLASATALNALQVNEIVGGLEDIGTLANQLENSGALGAEIEALGLSFGDLFNFSTTNGKGGFLGEAFTSQLDDLMTDALSSGGPTVAQINTWLGTSPLAGTTGEYDGVTWSLINGGEYTGAHPLEFEVVFTGTKTTENDLVGGQPFDDADIAIGGAKVSTDASASFKFSFGLADTDAIPGLSVGDSFFATFGDLTFTLDGSAPLAGMGGTVTYTKNGNTFPYDIATGSTISLGAQFGGVTITGTGTTTATSRLQLTTLALGFDETDYDIATTTDDGLAATLQLQRNVGATAIQLTIDDSAILDGADPTFAHDVSLVDFVAGGNVTGIFQKIQDAAQLLDTNPLRQVNLPGIATALNTLDDLPAFRDLLALRNAANNYMMNVASPTIKGLATQLETALTTNLAGIGITLDTLSLTTEFDPSQNTMVMNFAVDTGDITKSFEFDRFGAAAAQAGLSFNRDQTFTFDATLRAQGAFNFGLDLNHAASSGQSVFFSDGGLGASVAFDVTGIDLEATLGPVAASIVDGEIHATAALDLDITGFGAGDGRVTLAELNQQGAVTFDLTPSGTFEAILPLDIKIAGATFTNPTIRLESANIFTDLPTVDTTTANFDKLFNMGRVGPEAILDLIIAVGDWASNFRDSDVFDINIPFLNADLGNAFDFGLFFTKNLRDKLQDDLSYVPLKSDFASVTLASAAPLIIGNGEFNERIVVDSGTYATKTAFIDALNTKLGTSSKFVAEAHGDNGVRIAAKDANDVSNFSVMGATYQLKAMGFVASSTVVTSEVTLPLAAPANGKITADAQFQVSIDGATPVTITVTKTSTDTNTTAADLAADIDAALASAGIDASVASGKIKLTRTDGKSFMLVGVSGTTFQQLGLENASAAGLADLGSTLQSGLTYSTLTDMVPMLLAELGFDDGNTDPSDDPIQARYDVATESFIFKFQHEFIAPSITLPVGFNFDLDGWAKLRTVDSSGNPAKATLSLTPTLGGSFEFGISLADDNSYEELGISAPTGFAPKGYAEKADGSPDSNDAIAWDGKLTGDAVFKISFDDGVEHTLTVLKSATDANTTMAHLLADVKAAITANSALNGKIDARVVAKSGGTSDRIELFTVDQTDGFDLRNFRVRAFGDYDVSKAASGPSYQQLALTASAGFAANGKLAADATFSIALDGGTAQTLTILKTATDANTTGADLLADVKAAITANTGLSGKIDARIVAAGGGNPARIEFFTLDQTGTDISRISLVATGTDKMGFNLRDTMGFQPDQLEMSSSPVLAVANNSGSSMDYSPGGDVQFSIGLDGAAPVQVTVTAANMASNANMTDLLADINAAIGATALSGQVKASRYGLGNQFQFVAIEGTRQMTFSSDSADTHDTLRFSNGTDAFDPGDIFKVTARSRGGTFFIQEASLEASATLTLGDLNLAADIGFVGIKTTGLEGSVTITAGIELKDAADNTRFEVGELFSRVNNGSIGDIVQLDFDGTAHAEMTGLQISAGDFDITADALIELDATDIFAAGGPDFTLTFDGFDFTKLNNLSNASWREIYEGIKLGVSVLSQTEQFDFLGDTKIPLINVSVTEVFSYTDQLVAIVDQLEADPGGSLDTVEHKIEELLGIPDENFDLSLEGDSTIKIHLGISTSFSASYGLDFNLANLADYTGTDIPTDLLTLGGFLDASAEGSLQVGAYAGLSLDLGIDFSNGASAPNLIVYASSGVDLGLRVSGQNLNIRATFGPAGFEITDGSAIMDGDGLFDDDNKNGIEDNTENDGKPLVPGVDDTWVDDDLQDNDFALVHFGPLEDITDLQGTIDDLADGTIELSDVFGPTFSGIIVATLPGAITSDIGSLDLPGPIVLKVEDLEKLFNGDADAVELTLPDMSDLLPEIPGLIQLLRDPAILLDGVDSGLGLISKLLAGKAATNLPLIGDQLRQGSGFIEEFRAGFLADLTNKLRGAGDTLLADMQTGMFDLFGAEADGANGLALGILKDYNGDGSITAADVVLSFRKADGSIWVEGEDAPQDQEAVMFNLHLGQGIEFGTDLDIEWGLPGLELDINGSPQITAGWDLYFGFGVSINDFFFLDAAPPEEFTGSGATLAMGDAVEHTLSLGFEVVLTSDEANPFSATGRLFFLQLDATDKLVDPDDDGPEDAAFSHVSGTIFVDLIDPGTGGNADDRVTIKELFSRGTVKPLTAGIEAEAVVNLALAASVGGSTAIPRILTDFHLDWSWELGQAVETPNVAFENARLDLGSFVSDFLKPIVNKVNEIIKPFDPVLDALQMRIPVLSDLMGRNYTVLDLAVQFGKVDRRFVDAVLQVRQLVADIAALPDGVSIEIPIGEMLNLGSALSTKGGAKTVDTSSQGTSNLDFGAVAPGSDAERYRNTFNKSTSITGGGFGFPILKPANAFKLLLGQDATLITYDIPRLEASMSMSRTFPIWGPLVGKFSGSITAYADFAVGFDTKGFNTYRTSGDVTDILDGFYVSDRANADGTGADVYEAGFKGRIGIGGAINAAVVEAGIEGFFELRADLDLKDPNDDGKIRGSEIIALLTHPNGYGPLNLGSIRLRGDVGARAYVDFWAPFDWYNAWEWEFARITLFDKTFSAPDVTPTLGKTATVGAESTLTLNAGTSANQRQFISTSDVGEEFIIGGSGKNITVTFTNTGHTQSFSGVDRVVFNGGKGSDRLIVGAGITTAFTFNGGEGDDYFEGGDGNDIVDGGIGNDTILGGKGNNTLDGGDGADTITGGSGNDIIIGGKGDDMIDGKGGNDTYRFADDWGSDFFDGDQTGTGAFDFTPVTKDLTLNISARGAQGSSGNNFIAFESDTPYVTSVKGGSGNDVTTVAATGSSIVTVDGGVGSDQYIVSFGRLETAINIQDTGSGVGESDTVTIRPLSREYTIDVGDLYVSGTKTGLANTQRADFSNDKIENLTVDAKANGGSIVQIAEAISFTGDVRLLARQALIGKTVDAGNLRVESTQAVNIAANVNAHANGDVTVLVNSGDITISEDVMSSSGAGFTGDGAGLIHLFTNSGAISTGTASDNSHGQVLAAQGSLLLRGTGSIGTAQTPIYSTVATMAVSTSGNSLVNLHESDGVVIGTIASIEGITATGGTVTIFNDANELRVASRIEAGGGDTTLTSDEIEIDANINSPGGDIFLRPEGDLTEMAIGDNVTGTFALDQSEITHLQNGFASIQIGLPLGRNLINLGDATFQDVTLLQNPILGGHIDQTGVVTVTDGASFTILGSGHTTELDNQNVAGNIDIIDSAVVKEGETVTLTSTGGAININFDLDGTAGGADETLILSAFGDVVIKGAIGSVAKLGTLKIIGATNIRFEGSVNVETLIMDAGTTFTVDGTVTADDIQLNGVATVTFHSGVALTTALTTTGSVLNTAIFEGQVSAPTITISAKQLVDFYQLVDVTTTLTVATTLAGGDIVFRQQVNAHSGDIAVQSLDDITFIGPVAGDALSVAAVDSLAFQANVELLGALTQTAGTGVSSFTQLTAASANITSAGVLLGGITTLNGAAGLVVNVGTGTFSASNSVSAPNGPINLTARSIAFQGTVSAASATLSATESITVANASSFTLTGALSATTTSAAIGEIKFSGPVDVGTNATLNTPRGLTFQNTLDVDGTLTVQAASSAAYQGAVKVGGAFVQQNGVTGATSFTATLQAGSLNLQAGSFAFSGDVNSTGAASISANTGGISATSNVSAGGTLTANAATNIALQGATTAHQMMMTAAGTVTVGAGGLNTAASPGTGNIVITTTGPVAGNSVTLNGAVLAKGGVQITATQGVLASNTVNAASVNASGSALTFNSLVTTTGASIFNTTGALNLAAGLNAGGPLTVGSAASVTFGDGVTAASANVTATNTINIAVGGMTSTTGGITLTTTAAGAGNSISALGAINAAGALGITTPRGISLNVVEAASFTADAASINLPAAVTTTGATTLTAAASGNITAGSTINAGGALTINRAKAVTFGSLVNASSIGIGQGGTDSIETVAIGVGGMTATNDLRIRTTVAGAGNGITSQGPLTAGNAATLALNSVRGVDITGSIGTGDLDVNAASITLRSAVTAADDVTLTSAGAVALNANLTATGDIAVTQAAALTFGAQVNGATLSIANTSDATFSGKATITGAANIAVTNDITTTAEFAVGGALNVTTVRDLSFGGLVNAGSVNIGSTSARTVTIGAAGMTTVGDMTIASTATGAGNGIITNGPLTAGAANAITLTSARGVDATGNINTGDLTVSGTSITLRSAVNAQDDVTLTSPGAVSFTTSLTAGGDIAVTQAGALTFGAQVNGATLTIGNTQSATFNGKATITGAANIAVVNDMTTSAEFSAGGALNITSVRDLAFGGFVSAGSVNIGSTTARTVTVGSAGMTTVSNLTIASTVAGTGNGIITNGPLTAGAANAITLTSVRGIEVNGTLNAGDINLSGSPVTVRGVVNAGNDVTLTSPGAISFIANLTAGGDIVVAQAGALSFGAQVQGATLSIANTDSATFSGKTTITGAANIAVTNDMTTSAELGVGGALNITSVRDLSFGGFVNAGSVNIGSTTARIVTVSASGMTAAGDITIVTNVAGAGNGIVTNGPLTTGATSTLTLTSVRGVEVNGSITAGDVNLTGSPLTIRGVVNAGDDLTLGSTGAISFTSDVNVAGDVIVTQAASLSFGAKLTATDLLVTNTGNATFTGVVTLTGLANLALTGDLTTGAAFTVANSFVVSTVRDVSFGGLVSAATVNIGGTSARTISVNAAGMSTTGALTLRSTDAAGALNLNGPLTAANGAVTLSALGTVTSTATINGDTISVISPVQSLGGSLVADGAGTTGNILLDSTTANNGTINVGGVVTSSGSLLVGTVTAPKSASLTGALNIGEDLTIRASETITTGAQADVVRDASFTTTSSAAGEVRLNGSLTTGRHLLLNTPRNATFIAPVTVGGDATVTNAAALQFDGALTVTGALTQVAGTTSSRFASISAASIAINSPTVAVTNAVTATSGDATFTAGLAGKVTVGGNTNVAGALSVTRADEVILTGNVTAASVNVGSTSVRTMTFGTNLNATAGGVTLTGANGPISVLGTLNATGALNIPTGTVITLSGAVSAASANIAGGTLVTGNDVTTTTGGLAITTSGDVTVAGKTTVAQTLSILGSDDVNLAGAVIARDFTLNATSFLAGGAFTTNVGDANFTTTGNIRVVGLASVAEDLTITTALNTTFQGQVTVVGALTQLDGGNTTRFEGVTSAANINVRTAQQIFAGSTLRAVSGDMRLEADEIDFFGGTNAVQGTANLTLRPYLAGTSIDIGSPTPTGILDLSDVDLNALQDGFTQITIGRAEDGTGAMLIGSSSFKDNVAFHAGSIVVESNTLVGQVLVSLESIEMTARTGSITTNDDVLATDVVMTARDNITINNKVEVADFVVFTAGTDGSGNITHNGALSTSAANGTVDFTAGANAGNITITGTISTFDFDVTAVSGAIIQTAGNTKASDILALAQSGITLLTTADHISARVTGSGDLNITDTNPSDTHFLDLGSKTDLNDGLFTADGDITVFADQNVNAYRIEANGAVTIETGGEVYLDRVSGAPVSVTGTILIDEDRTTNGEEIRFDGNIRLLRDITLTSNGGNIIITGKVNGTNGQHYGLTFNAGGGDVTIGSTIGNVTPLEFLQVNDAGLFKLGGGARIEDDTEINADAVEITAPKGSILTTNGGELRFLPNAGNATIDIGGPAGGNAAFSLNDAELAALGDGFSLIQLGQRGGTHDFKIESARFLDDLEINGDNVTLLTSSIAQAVNGISVVNGVDDNDITINARTSFNQGSRAGLTAGRNGNIAITADSIALDDKSRGLIRGFGELLLQPFTTTRAMTLGGAGAGFEITSAEFGALGETFSKVTLGRADGAHIVNIQTSLSFRDNTVIRTPAAGGSVTIGNGTTPITVQTVGRADSLRIESAGTISVDGNVKTVGRGNVELLADFDGDGAGDLLIGQNLTTKANKTLTIGSELGAIRLQGENVRIGIEVAEKTAGIVNVKSLSGDISVRTNVDGDGDGNVTYRHAKSVISTNGAAKLTSANHGGIADLGGGSIFAKRGVDISGFAELIANATKVKADAAISVEALKATLKAKSAFTSLAEIMITGNQTTGVIALEKGASLSAKNLVRLDAADVQRDPGAAVKAKTVIIDEI